jgi:hypothetical protein
MSGSPTTARPGPVARSEESAAFFDGTAEGRFLLVQCEHGHWNRPQARACAECGSRDLHPEPSAGRATLVSWVVVHPRPSDDGSTSGLPSVPAIVELEEGPWWWTQLVDVDPDQLRAGAALQVVFERPDGSEAVPVFTIAAAPAG